MHTLSVKTLALLLSFEFLLAFPAAAQDAALSAKVDDYIKREMQENKIPGVSVAVIRDGKIIHAKGYGLANVEHNVSVTPETVFQSGSVGKAFTVLAVMMLSEEGKIGLDDKIKKYFPDAPAEWDAITVRNLLQHTSGMDGYPKDFNFRADYTEDELYKKIKALPLVFKLGEKRGYSNLGFVMLGILINKVTGKFYGDFLKESVFGPLGMSTARVISESDIVPNRSAGYRLVNGELKNQEWVAPSLNTTADGALYLTVLDMAKFEAALNSGKLLQRSSYDAMWTQLRTNDGAEQPWGFSWQIENINGKRIIEHSGGWQGFTANFSRYPEQKTAVIVFTNLRGVNPVRLCRGVQEIYHPELGIAAIPAIADTEPQVTEFVKDFVKKVAENKMTAELFEPALAAEILRDADRAAADFSSYGPLNNIELLECKEPRVGSRVYTYRLTYKERQIVLTLSVTKENKISDIAVRR